MSSGLLFHDVTGWIDGVKLKEGKGTV